MSVHGPSLTVLQSEILFCPVEEGGRQQLLILRFLSHAQEGGNRHVRAADQSLGCGSESSLCSMVGGCAGSTASWGFFAKQSCVLWEKTQP